MEIVRVATCNLNQWALDFTGNEQRILHSFREAKLRGAAYRLGPELEVTGYGCEDHFYESDTELHAWESLTRILTAQETQDILGDVGMPVTHRGVRYNCRIFFYNRRILLIRPKMYLADDGNYREGRWFTGWPDHGPRATCLEDHLLPACVQAVLAGGQTMAPFGVAMLESLDGVILGAEMCEELFTPSPVNARAFLQGCDIVSNGSASHHQLRKLHKRVELMQNATSKCGGCYVYSNQQGCDGGRCYYDGCAMVLVNGKCVAQASQFSLRNVEVVTADVDIADVRSYRASIVSGSRQAAAYGAAGTADALYTRIHVPCSMLSASVLPVASPARPVVYVSPEEEIALGPACWLWDFLRRSGAGGYFLPLSGGADSSAVCAIVGVMCALIFGDLAALDAGDPLDAAGCPAGRAEAQARKEHALGLLGQLAKVVGSEVRYGDVTVGSGSGGCIVLSRPADIAACVLHTCYMGTVNSSQATRDRAALLASEVGAYHVGSSIDAMVAAVLSVFTALFGLTPRFAVRGGTRVQDLALQNVQARLRMVWAYFLAQLLPWVRGRSGFLLVLGSANVDEALRGYLTKYDCSSADLNPIGSVSKSDLKRFLVFAATAYALPSLADIVAAPPTAELQPLAEGAKGSYVQLDEVDMGMSYAELEVYGTLRKNERCGPYSMYLRLVPRWGRERGLSPCEVAVKIKRFFTFYSINRHKLTTLTPAYHAESYSPDDNRYDHRQFLYCAAWERQFEAIDRHVALMEAAAAPARAE